MKAIIGDLLVDANGVKKKSVVLVEGDRIIKVGSRDSLTLPSDTEVIDASGLVLMPGMIDCHVHFTGSRGAGVTIFREPFETRLIRAAVKEAQQLLEAGFTSAMDAGGQVGLYVRNAINEGIVSGPRVMSAGRHISCTAGHGDTLYMPLEWVKEGRPMGWGMEGRIADGVDDCMRAVRENLRLGVDFIKICTSGGGGQHPEIPEYTLEEITAMVHIAHSWGRKVMVHCYNPEGIRLSVLGGVDIISHGNLADEASIKLMSEHGTVVVPTMSIYYSMARRREESKEPLGAGSRVRRMSETLFDDIRRLYDGGLTLALGTDTMGVPLAFGKNALELELYLERVGLSPLEAIKIGTLNGAIAMGKKDLGTLEAGKLADIIAVEENPLDNIKSLQDANNTKLVMKGGDIYKNNL